MVPEGVAGSEPVTEEKPAVAATGATGSTGEPNPDKSKWDTERAGLLRDLQTERTKRQGHETQLSTFQAQIAEQNARIQALAGVAPKSKDDIEAESIKTAFAKLYPELAGLTKEDIEAIRENKNASATLKDFQQRQWDTHARSMVSQVESKVKEELGGKDDLTPRQTRALRAAFAAFIETDEGLAERYDKGDAALIDEFVKDYVADWFEPVRRKTERTTVESRVRVPSGKDRAIPGTDKKIDVTDPKAVEDVLVAGFKKRGGEFTGRR